jgi:hypothetical protein
MKDQIKEFIRSRDNVSFPELMKAIPDSAGDRAICHDNDNLILWGDMSQPFVDTLEALLADGSIEFKRVSLAEIAMIHSCTRDSLPDSPIAEGIRKYKTPHWLPVIIRTRKK